jgi:ankyrin repeat protein
MNDKLWRCARPKHFVKELKIFVEKMKKSKDQTLFDIRSQYNYDLTDIINDVLNIIGITNNQTNGNPNEIVNELVRSVNDDKQIEDQYLKNLNINEMLIHKSSIGDYNSVKSLIESNEYIFSDEVKFEAIYYATQENQRNIVKLLSTNKINLNDALRSQIPPLFRAVINNNLEMTQILIEAGADPNYKFDHKTALSEAVYFNDDDTISKFLISKGSNIEIAIDALEIFDPSNEVQEKLKIKGLEMLNGFNL